MKTQSLFITVLTCLFLFSCKKGELAIAPHDAGDVTSASINMDANYKWQIYYDLESNTTVGKYPKTSWDLAFEASESGFHVILNSAKAMFSSNTFTTDFEAISDTTGFAARKAWDEPTGNLDSTAIGDWRGNSTVYLIDRGYSETGLHQGFQKIQLLSVNSDGYVIRFAALDGTGETTLEIEKDDAYTYQYISFDTKNVVEAAPKKDTWDICFSQYTHIFYDPLTTYLVTGCLLNPYQTEATKDSLVDFQHINFDSATKYTLSKNINCIGYSWKEYAGGIYTTKSYINYILKNRNGLYFKLHFIDFYTKEGIKGNPIWEFQQM